jgi:prephenate dehydrogenase
MSAAASSFRSVLIYGMGMMGASLALALRRVDPSLRIAGVVRSASSAEYIREQGMADEVLRCATSRDAAALNLSSFDLLVIAAPVLSTVELAQSLPGFSGLITDMSSTREAVEAAFALRPDLRFVGSHPMCGSENRGPQAARAELYEGRLCILTHAAAPVAAAENDAAAAPAAGAQGTPPGGAGDAALIEQLWRSLGMHVYAMTPAAHDEALAYLSHAPHLISGLMTIWADQRAAVHSGVERAPIPISGGGFKDMSRIAGSNPEMWRDILATNRVNIRTALERFRDDADRLIAELDRAPLETEWWDRWFRSARTARNFLCGYPPDA